MQIQENIPLKDYTTFHIGGNARYFIDIENEKDAIEALQFVKEQNQKLLILGEGSNVIIKDSGFDGVVIHTKAKGIQVLNEDETSIIVEAQAGVIWDDFVEYSVQKNIWGNENLSLIPGTVGASVVQNIGAYGAEVSETVKEVHCIDIHTLKEVVLSNQACQFEYRKSVFNSKGKGKYLITKVIYTLSKTPQPNLQYKDIQEYFSSHDISSPTLQQIRTAIIDIRNSKLPDTEEMGNAGSFFKNTLISEEEFHSLIQEIKTNFSSNQDDICLKLNSFKERFTRDGIIKIPTAYLIEICNLKGKNIGNASIYEKSPLVIVNKNNTASFHDVKTLFEHVQTVVQSKTGILLENEPQFI